MAGIVCESATPFNVDHFFQEDMNMKKLFLTLLLLASLMSSVSVSVEAISFSNSDNIPYSEKIPIETPHFKPILDTIRDEGYTASYEIKETTARFHEGTFLSTAWYGNTLYFHLFVPDVTPQDRKESPMDGGWFALYFGGDSDKSLKWTENENAKIFRIHPRTEQIEYRGASWEESVAPPKDEDFQYIIDYTEEGYTLELAYTVPETLSDLRGTQEIAFEIMISDVNDGFNYRYLLANEYRHGFENFCTAWGAKLVLGGASDTEETTEPLATDTVSHDTTSDTQDVVSDSDTAEATVPDSLDGTVSKVPYLLLAAVVVLVVVGVMLIKNRGNKSK